MQQKAQKARLTEGAIGLTLVKLTIPMIFGVLGMVIFNIIDTFFVGQLGTHELAALSFTFPVVLVVSSLAMGLGVGTSAMVSRAIGEGYHARVQRLTTDSLVLSVLLSSVLVIIGLLTMDPVFRLLGATPEILPLVKQYMVIWFPGAVFMIVPMVGNNAIRATGDTKTPSYVMLVAVIINMVLDPLFIFGIGPFPRLEIAGAALTTLFARAITFVVALWVLYRRERMITITPPNLNEVLHSWKSILYIGLPTAGATMIIPLTIGVVTRLVSAYGPVAVAAFGAASRIDMFSLVIVMALSSALGPFVGQNWGAGGKERVRKAVAYGQYFSLGWGLLVFLILALAGKPIAALFNDNPNVVATMVLYFWIVPLGYGFQGVVYLSNGVLNVLHRPLYAAGLTIVQTLLLQIPLAYVGGYLFGLNGIFGAAVVANTMVGTIALVWLRRIVTDMDTPTQKVAAPQVSRPQQEAI
ncbi:MAG: MATE family efflux transporter [Chloroflexaceae bacterium]|nr:MATE family efflux transporter [Chloroflexaceae bacterium]